MGEMKKKETRRLRIALALPLAALCAGFYPTLAPQAQRSKERSVSVTGVSARATGEGALVSIKADAPLTRAQTWQDGEGFHVVVYKGQAGFQSGVPRGVKVRRVGDSLELVVPVRAGGSVTVHPRDNGLDLSVSGGLHAVPQDQPRTQGAANAGRGRASREEQRAAAAAAKPRAETGANSRASGSAAPAGESKAAAAVKAMPASSSSPAPKAPPQGGTQVGALQQPPATQNPQPQQTGVGGSAANDISSSNQGGAANPNPPPTQANVAAAPSAPQEAQAYGQVSLAFVATIMLVFLVAGLAVFLFLYRRQRQRSGQAAAEKRDEKTGAAAAAPKPHGAGASGSGKAQANGEQAGVARKQGGEVQSKQQPGAGPDGRGLVKYEGRAPAPPPTVFGAYRIEQEVDKLVRGETHAVGVIASRAADDRRAVETSLLKSLQSPSACEEEKRRVRQALEEYGFVARQSAAMLLSPDAYERASAARAVGAMRSTAALPFLLEALYDPEPVVCAEAVASIGALGQPAAIGALLDVARRQPSLPPALVGNALSACSVDCLEMRASGDGLTFAYAGAGFTGDIRRLEPAAPVEQLPAWLEDETLVEALARLESADVEARVAAAQRLGQFQVQRSVDALSLMAQGDRDASVRAAAVTSLGLVGHESVFPSVLIGMADESREVRAAAARALSRLNFDRADAYARVIETADGAALQRLAQACVAAGLGRQALDRLASEDRRHAYEAFSLLSLVAKGGETAMMLEAVEQHREMNVRQAVARLLGLTGQPGPVARLREIAGREETPEALRAVILETVFDAEPAEVASYVVTGPDFDGEPAGDRSAGRIG